MFFVEKRTSIVFGYVTAQIGDPTAGYAKVTHICSVTHFNYQTIQCCIKRRFALVAYRNAIGQCGKMD